MLGNFFGPSGRLKTLIDRLTATRAANLDKLDANISSRAAASTALSNATWSDARAAKLDNADAATSTRAPATSPALAAPVASGLPLPSTAFLATGATYSSQGIVGFPVAAVTASQTTAYQSLVSVSGAGVLQLVSFGANNSTPTIRITIDGAVVLEQAAGGTTSDWAVVGGYTHDGVRAVALAYDSIPFHSSLLIEAKAGVATGTVYVRYKYRRTA